MIEDFAWLTTMWSSRRNELSSHYSSVQVWLLSVSNNNHSCLLSLYLNAMIFFVYIAIVFVHFSHALPMTLTMMTAMMATMAMKTMMIILLYSGLSTDLCKHLMLMVLMLARLDFRHVYLELDDMTFVDDCDDYDNDALIIMAV